MSEPDRGRRRWKNKEDARTTTRQLLEDLRGSRERDSWTSEARSWRGCLLTTASTTLHVWIVTASTAVGVDIPELFASPLKYSLYDLPRISPNYQAIDAFASNNVESAPTVFPLNFWRC